MAAESLQSELEGYAVGAVVFLVVVGAFLWCAAWFADHRCAARWEGRTTRYTAVAGCLVEQDGAFVPEMAGR